jgi:uncharacterized protein YndB with AHSA1/START domain
MTRQRFTLERHYAATLAELWELWTTKDGVESWWGPDGFRVEVHRIDVRPRGEMAYAMIAEGRDQIAFMESHGMPTRTEHVITYTEVAPQRRLGWTAPIDFTEVPAYEVDNLVEMTATDGGVRLVMSFDAMHSDVWNGRMIAGWEMELDKLARRVSR